MRFLRYIIKQGLLGEEWLNEREYKWLYKDDRKYKFTDLLNDGEYHVIGRQDR